MTRGSPKNKRGAPQPPEERPATKRGRRGDPASPPSRPRSGGQAAGEQARSTRAGSRDKELVEASQEPERLLRQQKRAAKQPKQAVSEQQQRRASAEEQAAAAVAAAAAGANMERRQSGGGGRQSGQQVRGRGASDVCSKRAPLSLPARAVPACRAAGAWPRMLELLGIKPGLPRFFAPLAGRR